MNVKLAFTRAGPIRSVAVVASAERVDGVVFLSAPCPPAEAEAFLVQQQGHQWMLAEGGAKITLDAHGIWMVDSEVDALMKHGDPDQVPWVDGVQPAFPPAEYPRTGTSLTHRRAHSPRFLA